MRRATLIALGVLFILPTISFAQQWSKEFDKEVNFIKMTEAGVAVVGTDDALYGINGEGEVLWHNEKLRKVEENRVEILSGSELIFVSDKGLMARNRAINVLTGVEYADRGVKFANIFAAAIVHPANLLLVLPDINSPESIEAWDINSNKVLWTLGGEFPYAIAAEKMASLTATFQGMQPFTYTSNTSGILHLGLGHLAEYDFTTGQPKWQFDFGPYKIKKPGKDNSDTASNPSKGYAAMKFDEASNTLYFPFRNILIAIDASTGRAKWDVKANKTGLVKDIYVTNDGVLVLTAAGLELLDPATGTTIWDKGPRIKGGGSGLLVREGEVFYVVSKKYIYKIDVANARAEQLTDKIKFQGNESFSSIELQDDLIILSSSQNIVGIYKNTGAIAFQEYYKAPGASLATIAGNIALATVAVASTMNSQRIGQQNADALGNYSYYQYTPALRDGGTRNSLNTNNFKYINTKFKGKGFGMAKVNKTTGELEEEIIIGDRSPIYATDENTNLIFYKSAKKMVNCKRMN